MPSSNQLQISIKLLLPILAAMVAITPLALDLYLPGFPSIAKDLNTSIAAIQNSLSTYLIGFATGMLIFGPLVDKVGRRKLALFGILGFGVASLALSVVTNIDHFIALRFVQAFLGSAATVVVPGVIRQVYCENTAKGMSYVSMIMMIAPMVAPAFGSLLLLLHSWQAMFYFLTCYAAIIAFLSFRFLPESSKNQTAVGVSILGNYKAVFSNVSARRNILTTIFSALAFFSYITAIPFVYMHVFNTNEFTFSMLFALNVFSLMLAQWINTRLVVKRGSPWMMRLGFCVAITASILFLIITLSDLPVFFTAAILMPLMGGLALVTVNNEATLLIKFEKQTGTISAVLGVLKFGVGSLAGPILAIFYDHSALPFSTLLFISLMIIGVIQWPLLTEKNTKGVV